MNLSHLTLTAMLLIGSSAPGLAQVQSITVDSEPTPEQIKAWLGSSESLEVAWGAWFAGKTADGDMNDDAYVTIMARRMARWIPEPIEGNRFQDSHDPIRITRSAMSEILYALIEKNESVPALSLEPIARKFPTEALILAARLHDQERTQFLGWWYEKRNDAARVNWDDKPDPLPNYSAIAAMLLSKTPPPGFAASVVAESDEKLAFWLADSSWEDSRWYGGATRVCKDQDQEIQLPSEMEDDVRVWPPLFQYQLQTDVSPEGELLLVEVSGYRIGYRRISILTRPSFCRQPDKLTDEVRHHILAELLGLRDDEMPWQAQERQLSFAACGSETAVALKKQVSVQESKLTATVQALFSKGLLTKQEARDVRPRLTVTAIDVRSSCSHGRMHSTEANRVAVSNDPRTLVSFDLR
jgi:hypothetical protein